MYSYHRVMVIAGKIFLSVCMHPNEWDRKCSPTKITDRLCLRHASFIPDWWYDRGLKTDTVNHTARFMQEPSEV